MSSISVIIPCRNGAKFLADAIESVLAQTHPALEIIVVDDGSTDETANIVADYRSLQLRQIALRAGRLAPIADACTLVDSLAEGKLREYGSHPYPDILYLQQASQGISVARNAGIRASKGQYLVFLDHDDRLLPNALAIGARALHHHPHCGFTYGSHQVIESNGAVLESNCPRLELPFPTQTYALMLSGQFPVPPARIMFRRTVFDQVGLYDPTMLNSQDYDLCLRVAAEFPAYLHGQVVAQYRQHQDSRSSTTLVSRKLDFTLRALKKQWPKVKHHPEYRQAYWIGRRHFQKLHGYYLPYELAEQVKRGHVMGMLRAAIAILRHHPQGIFRYAKELLARRPYPAFATGTSRLSSTSRV
ncbi:MAG: glycosyltransferase [Oculatellaceae cyanobacterium Prado106]|jgi:glycosyltransferase involved in cell wall biosynthesis|nr:glycosyltransferase [Oculatellaceae cyanobacterium Prado106]